MDWGKKHRIKPDFGGIYITKIKQGGWCCRPERGRMIIDKDIIENATLAYLHSYKIALENTHNPNFAVQVAAMVVMILINKEESKKIDPLQMLISLAVKERQQEDDNNSIDKEDKT